MGTNCWHRLSLLLMTSVFLYVTPTSFAHSRLDDALGHGLSIFLSKMGPAPDGYAVTLDNVSSTAILSKGEKGLDIVHPHLRQYSSELATFKDSLALVLTQYLLAETKPSYSDSSLVGLSGLTEGDCERVQSLLDHEDIVIFALRLHEDVIVVTASPESETFPDSLTPEGLTKAGIKFASGPTFAAALNRLYPELNLSLATSTPHFYWEAGAASDSQPQVPTASLGSDVKKLLKSWVWGT